MSEKKELTVREKRKLEREKTKRVPKQEVKKTIKKADKKPTKSKEKTVEIIKQKIKVENLQQTDYFNRMFKEKTIEIELFTMKTLKGKLLSFNNYEIEFLETGKKNSIFVFKNNILLYRLNLKSQVKQQVAIRERITQINYIERLMLKEIKIDLKNMKTLNGKLLSHGLYEIEILTDKELIFLPKFSIVSYR